MSIKIKSQNESVKQESETLYSTRTKRELKNHIFNVFTDPEVESELLKEFNYSTIKQMNTDPVIAFSYSVLSSVISSLPYTVTCDNEVQEALIKDMLDRHFFSLMEGMCTSIYNGFAFSQKLYRKEHVNYRVQEEGPNGKMRDRTVYKGTIDSLYKIKWIDPSSCQTSYVADRRTEELKYVYQLELAKKRKVSRRDLYWFGGEDTFDPIFGKSRYLNIYFAWEITRVLIRYLIQGVDITSTSMVEVRYPKGMTTSQDGMVHSSDLAKELLDKIVSGETSYTLPSDRDNSGNYLWEVSVNKDASDANSAIYDVVKDLIIMFYGHVMMGVFMPPALNPVDEAKDLGDSETSMELLMLTSERLIRKMEIQIQKDFIDDIIKMNIPEDKIRPYEFSIDKSIFNRRSLMKELLNRMLQIVGQGITSGTAMPHDMPDLGAILEQLNVPTTTVNNVFKTLNLKEGSILSSSIADTVNMLREREEEETKAEEEPLEAGEEEGEESDPDGEQSEEENNVGKGLLDIDKKNEQRESSRIQARASEKMRDGGKRITVIKGA